MTSFNEPVQPVGYMAPPTQGDSTFGGGGMPTPPTAQSGMNTMAVLALVFAFVFSPLGVVFGVLGRRQIARTGERGKGLATAGLVLGAAFTLLGILVAVLVGVLAANTAISVPKSSVESQIATQLEASVGTRPDSVSCATDLAATIGATDACTVVVGGTSLPVGVVVSSVDGKTVKFDINKG